MMAAKVSTQFQVLDNTKGNSSQVPGLFSKKLLSNGHTIFDFDEDLIISKMESLMEQLDSYL